MKHYESSYEDKESFINEVIAPFVYNEGHFKECSYIHKNNDNEIIQLVPYRHEIGVAIIDISCDSVEAICRDFMRGFLKILEEI